jgi:hypothetical protein
LNRKRWHEEELRIGRGPLLSARTLQMVGRALIAQTPALNWAKGQVVVMLVTLLLVVWGVDSIADLTLSGYGDRAASLGLIKSDAEGESGEGLGEEAPAARELLRDDLFEVPRAQQEVKAKEPRTNPVELLRLIQLQGVLGGKNPKAMVLYKQTKETVTVSVGDDLGEFEVVEIRERSVVLKWRNELFEISL